MKKKIIWILLLIPLIALAADTGWNDPAGYNGLSMDYSNPTNVYSSNNNYATYTWGESVYTNIGHWITFSPGVPTGATIDGIEVSIEDYCSANEFSSAYVNIYTGGWRTQKALTIKTSEATTTYGSSSDTWGFTEISVSDANAIGVKVELTNNSKATPTHYIDNIRVRIYYTAAGQLPLNGVTDWAKVSGIETANVVKINGIVNE